MNEIDKNTKIHIVISIVLVVLISALAYWVQMPSRDLKADILSTDTVLVRIQDFAFDPDVVRIEPNTTVSWLHDESEGNADVQHTVTSYDPEDSSQSGDLFESDLMSLGDTYSEVFADPGVYYYNCSLHPFMTGKICVGADSELLDEDCGIAVTDSDDEVEDDTVVDDTLGDDADAADDDALAGDSADDTTDLSPAADEAGDTDGMALLGAADEDFDTSASDDTLTIQYGNQVPQQTYVPASTQQQSQYQPQNQQPTSTKLSSSGPEDFIYLFVALAAIFITKRVYSHSS